MLFNSTVWGPIVGFRKYTKYTHVQHNDKIQGRIELNSLTECGLWTPQTTFYICIVQHSTVKILGHLSWHSNLYPLYKTTQRTDFLFKSGSNIDMKRHKKIFSVNLFLSLSLSVAWLTFQLILSLCQAILNELLRTEKIFSIMALKHPKIKNTRNIFIPSLVLHWLFLPMLNYTTAHNCHHH